MRYGYERRLRARSGNSSTSLKEGPQPSVPLARWSLSGYNEARHSAVPYWARTVSDTTGQDFQDAHERGPHLLSPLLPHFIDRSHVW
jgi:hypothetical protein